ncbi:hypothetical protein [Burkholderia cenocepacia]|uniref:hypothetical protein n=1 Tax=Burkholderia cenocepacia TaxID=95486 RepID=UPI00196AC675|nr:hypothetical protein [Burkholderia cenocepacia]MBN3506334.1 hypothetical protein [Burkholderia cenocepacia]MBR8030397.1 hypothetical protein [Burkholderia cenocepacia]MBR8172201.1 hypothetical protein [Burkholderia cenocepacia]
MDILLGAIREARGETLRAIDRAATVLRNVQQKCDLQICLEEIAQRLADAEQDVARMRDENLGGK